MTATARNYKIYMAIFDTDQEAYSTSNEQNTM